MLAWWESETEPATQRGRSHLDGGGRFEGVATRPNPIAADAMTVVTGSADDAFGMEALFRIDNRGDEQPPVTVKVVARCCLTDTRVRDADPLP